jgi:hypothetical protein
MAPSSLNITVTKVEFYIYKVAFPQSATAMKRPPYLKTKVPSAE